MGSTLSIIGGLVGGIIGFFVGGPLGAVYGAAIGFGLGSVLDPITPDVPAPGRPQIGQLVITTADEGVPIADVLGTTKMTGNILWYANNRTRYVEQQQQQEGASGGFGGMAAQALDATGQNAPGYHYYLTFAMGLCIGPTDTLYTVYKGDECVWEGELHRPETGGEETVDVIDVGSMTFFFGTTDQVAPAAMTNLLEDPTLFTDYKRLCYAFFNDAYLGQYNRLPVLKFVFKKSPVLTFNVENQIESYFYNPAHAIYYIISQMIGLGEQYINVFTFSQAADKLWLEDRGVNMLFDRQAPALSYLESLLNHIDGVLRWGIDGRLHLKLMRDDEDTNLMQVVDESIMLDDFGLERKSWLDTQNEIKVQYPLLVIGDCELCLSDDTVAPVLTLESQNGSVGSYEITEGCPPFFVYYRLWNPNPGWGEWIFNRTIYGREFNGLASHVHCGGGDTDREMKLVDTWGRDSNVLDIKLRARTLPVSGGNPTVDAGSGSVEIDWWGGAPPFTLQTDNPLVTFDTQFYSQFKETNWQDAIVYFTDQACGQNKITLTDACGAIIRIYIFIDAHLAWNGGSSDPDIDPDDTAVVLWNDGIGPFDVELTGDFEDMWLNAAMTKTKITTGGNGITVYGGPGACGEATVEVTDSCEITVFGTVTSSEAICCNGEVPVSFVSPPETTDPSDTVVLTIQNGVPPYTWSILIGAGHFWDAGFTQTVITEDPSLTQTLHTNAGACGPVFIQVSDACGNQNVIEMKCTNGGWDLIVQTQVNFIGDWWGSNQPPPPPAYECDPSKGGWRFCVEQGNLLWRMFGPGGTVARCNSGECSMVWANPSVPEKWVVPPDPCDFPHTCNLDGCVAVDDPSPIVYDCEGYGDWICYINTCYLYEWTCSGLDDPACVTTTTVTTTTVTTTTLTTTTTT